MTPPPLTLVVLAAGRSTRFGRLKQLTPIGPSGEALLDYALHDGALAGFTRFVFVIQEEKRADFDAHLRPAVGAGLTVRYAYQSLSHPGLVDSPPPGRTRPWGTGHAVLAAAERIHGPFALCNADDFYGRGAYAALAAAMRVAARRHPIPESTPTTPPGPHPHPPHPTSPDHTTTPAPALTVGYPLEVTLSESGGVSRGICEVDEAGTLRKLTEGLEMRRAEDRVRGRDVAGGPLVVALGAPVCTNLWGFPEAPETGSPDRRSVPAIVPHLRNLFSEFLASDPGTDSEFYLSEAMNELVARGLVRCRVLPTRETWLGLTFPGDHARVAGALRALADSGVYPRRLWNRPPPVPADDD